MSRCRIELFCLAKRDWVRTTMISSSTSLPKAVADVHERSIEGGERLTTKGRNSIEISSVMFHRHLEVSCTAVGRNDPTCMCGLRAIVERGSADVIT
jgi:hypothetical protein